MQVVRRWMVQGDHVSTAEAAFLAQVGALAQLAAAQAGAALPNVPADDSPPPDDSGPPSGSSFPDAVISSASAAAAAINADPNYCTSVGKTGTPVNTNVHNFKTAWNATQSPKVPVGTGKFEAATATALAQVIGAGSPAACGAPHVSPVGPVGPVGPAPVAKMVTCPDASVHPAGFTCPKVPPKSQQASFLGNWGLLAAGGLVIGGGLIYFMGGAKKGVSSEEFHGPATQVSPSPAKASRAYARQAPSPALPPVVAPVVAAAKAAFARFTSWTA